MPTVGLVPIDIDNGTRGNFLTFIVPAPGGCNLNCPFCVVRQRQEASTENALEPHELARFIREVGQRSPVVALAIQGHEPLLPASMDHTQAVLSAGKMLGIPASLVTNGVRLREETQRLALLEPAKIGVSLDAAAAGDHDRIRGISGAWEATVSGLRYAMEVLSPRTKFAVASVLMSNREPLDGMPEFLRRLGIAHWIVTPLQAIGRDAPGGPAGNRRKLYENLLILQDAAKRAGIRLTVDDELDCLGHDEAQAHQPELTPLRVRTLPAGVDLVRLTPGGQCSMNRDILRQVTPATPRWRPGEMDAGEFLDGLKYGAAVKYAPAA